MKLHKIIVLIFVLVLPLQVNNAVACSPGEEPGDFGCVTCNRGTYNSTGTGQCQSCPYEYQNNWSGGTTNKQHVMGETSAQCENWECMDGFVPNENNECVQNCTNNIPANAQYIANCDWECIANFYDNNHNNCTECPHGATTLGHTGATSINQCYCPSNTYQYPNANNWTHCVTYSGDMNTNATGCATGASATTPSGSGNNWTVTCTCDSPAVLNSEHTACVCPNGYSTTVTDGVVHCAPCGPNQKSQNGTCVCKERYYGDADGCTACPSGTKVAEDAEELLPTSSTQADCRAYSGTKFCDANGQNCMKLLQ